MPPSRVCRGLAGASDRRRRRAWPDASVRPAAHRLRPFHRERDRRWWTWKLLHPDDVHVGRNIELEGVRGQAGIRLNVAQADTRGLAKGVQQFEPLRLPMDEADIDMGKAGIASARRGAQPRQTIAVFEIG